MLISQTRMAKIVNAPIHAAGERKYSIIFAPFRRQPADFRKKVEEPGLAFNLFYEFVD
jgi:hypothetical protein